MQKFNDSYYTWKGIGWEDKTFIWDMRDLVFNHEELKNDKFLNYYKGVYYLSDKGIEWTSDRSGYYNQLDSHVATMFYQGVDAEFMYYLNKHPNRDKWLKKYFNKPVKELVEYMTLKTANWKL